MEYSGSQKAESFLSSSKFKVLPRGAVVGASEAELLWLLPRVQGKVQEANMISSDLLFIMQGLSLDLRLSLGFFELFLRVLVMPQ